MEIAARASIEDEYSRKLLNLSKKALGSQESGTLRTSLDTMRGEVEAMAKQHQGIAAQMKTELEEPLAAFAGGMKERRKIVQNTVEKLLKTKIQQTQHVSKVHKYDTCNIFTVSSNANLAQTRDKYEQECLKIKGYLAQGHMVMGQEERRNKAKLEKTQISLAASNTEYENAVKVLEETTVRWNREWKAAADKFQDLEEERLDFTKSSLWTFANIASTVCVSDDASCEKIRLSLEKMDVETDIITFITDRGTGQEIPDAPKYINFCRGDINDANSDVSEDENYSVAQFPRSINPAFRSSSPQPSTFESHHDPNSALANNLAQRAHAQPTSREINTTPQRSPQKPAQKSPQPARVSMEEQYRRAPPPVSQPSSPYDAIQPAPIATAPHDPYPRDGMTMLCRPGPPSDRSSQPASARPSSRDSHSEYSNPTSFSSQEPPSGKVSPVKQDPEPASSPEKRVLKKKSGFFQNHSPFRRKSVKDMQPASPTTRTTWQAGNGQASTSPVRRNQPYNSRGETYGGSLEQSRNLLQDRTASPEPIDANASLALGVGQNVLPVTTIDTQRRPTQLPAKRVDAEDPIAQALAELKGVSLDKQSSVRMSADRYHGITTPVPAPEAAIPRTYQAPPSRDVAAASQGTPPPYQPQTQVTRLGVPPPAVTSKAMKEASKKVATQTRTIFGDSGRRDSAGSATSPMSRPGTRGNDVPRSTSPAPTRSVSPQPQRRMSNDPRRMDYRSVSPNPYNGHHHRNSSQASLSQNRAPDQNYYRQASPHGSVHGSVHGSARGASPSPYKDYTRPQSSYGGSDMAVQLAPVSDDPYGSQRSRSGRPESRAMGLYDGGHQRSKSVADPSRQYSRDGRPILHMGKF